MTLRRFFRVARQRLKTLARPRVVDAEIADELRSHVEALIAEKTAAGVPLNQAQWTARRDIGNLAAISEECRDARRPGWVGWIEDAKQDAAYGVRMCRKSHGLVTAAACSLALGIGASTAVLRAIVSMRVERFSLADAERYVWLRSRSPAPEGQLTAASAIDVVAWRDHTDVFDVLAASLQQDPTLGADSATLAERVHGLSVTAGFFASIGIRPAIGRAFSVEESRLINPAPAVIISDQLWRRRYGADPAILSRRLRLNGEWRPIVGVMPRDMPYRDVPVDCWVPLRLLPNLQWGSGRALRVTAKLKPGVTIARAEREVNVASTEEARRYPATFSGWTGVVQPLEEARLGWSRQPLLTALAIATLVLAVAAANVAGLFLGRASERRQEFSMRIALGAGRSRMIRQLLTEGVLVGALGGAAGLAVAWAALRELSGLVAPPGGPLFRPIGVDWWTVAIVVPVALAAGLASSAAPAWLAGRGDRYTPEVSAGETDRSWAARDATGAVLTASHGLRGVLAASQIAATVVLVVGAGLLLNSLVRLSVRDLHFNPDHLMTFELQVPTRPRAAGIYEDRPLFDLVTSPVDELTRLTQRFRETPNISAVAASSVRAIDPFVIPRSDVVSGGRVLPGSECQLVTPGYFRTMGTPVLAGREIAASDEASAPWVAVVNESAAARLWPGADPIGQVLSVDMGPDDRPRTVVGVVRDIPRGHAAAPGPIVYTSYVQQPLRIASRWVGFMGQLTFVVRYTGDWSAAASSMRQVAAAVDPDVPLANLNTVVRQLRIGRAGLTGTVLIATTLAVTGVLLALVGLYGVMAYGVSRHAREIAIRRALGAGPIHLIVGLGARVTAIVLAGLVAGLAASLPLARLLAPQLWGVTPADPTTYTVAALVVTVVVVIAAVAPARRVMALDPATVLRAE